MPYIEETCDCGKTCEKRRYHTARYGVKGETRSKKTKVTTEQQSQVNARKAERNLRRILNANFSDEAGDLLVTLDYKPKERPKDSREMQDHMRDFLRKLRRAFEKEGKQLKYVYVKELGPRGAVHVHMVMSHCDSKTLRKCWKRGGIDMKPLWTDGQYAAIAAYFVKYSKKTETTEGALLGKRYYPSKNIVRPKVVKKVITKSSTFKKNPTPKKGYYIEPDSVKIGVDELGYEYMEYFMHRIGNQTERKDE